MIGAVSGALSSYRMYPTLYAAQNQTAQSAQRSSGTWTAQRSASLELPVQPVRPSAAINANAAQPVSLPVIRQGADPAEMAVRMRIQPYQEPAQDFAAGSEEAEAAAGAESVQKTAEDGKCQTCEKRKYQDGSDDMGVSFQTPTRVDPDLAASAVRGHEMEHVVREQAKAQREDRRVVSQSVTLHTDICPECGKVYVSGGTTRTTTAANPEDTQEEQPEQESFSVFG